MTIQVSVLLWTVICFLLLVAILRNLLFKPVLRTLDERQERLDKAAEKRAEYERMEAEYAAELDSHRAQRLTRQQKELKAEMEKLRADDRALLKAANETRLRKVDRYSVKAEADCEKLLTRLSEQADELAVSFAQSLTK